MFKNKNNGPSEQNEAAINIDNQIQVNKDYDRSVPPGRLDGVNKISQAQIHAVTTKIRQAPATDAALSIVVNELQTILAADRVLICQTVDASTGKITAEAVRSGYTPNLGTEVALVGFGVETAADFALHRFVELERDGVEVSPYQKQLLDKLQVRSQITFPILLSGYSNASNGFGLQETWGLLCVQQCAKSKKWTEGEINLLAQISLELTLAIQPSLPLLQLVQNRDPLNAITLESQNLMQGLTEQVRASLQADRVMVFAYNPDWSGKVMAESVDVNWVKAGDRFNMDYSINNENRKEYYVVNDIQTKGLSRCLVENLETFQIRAYLVVPIVYNNQLLGMLGAYQNSGPRNWQKSELQAMIDFATKFSSPLQQTLYQRHQQFQAAQMNVRFQRERGLTRMQERIRNAQTAEGVFQVATQDGRKLLGVDRMAIYRFNDDWSGNFVAESVGGGWSSLLTTMPLVADTFLQRHEGGRYKDGGTMAIDDIYLSGHQACHIELLEQFEARAYAIAPVFGADKKLWGLIAIYQNDRVRKWQEDEVEALRQIGLQVGVALQLADYVARVENQERELAESLNRERTARENMEQEAVRVLMALEPSFRGDLTIRAPLSETEIGTIADGYNTTIQSLRSLVRQVQVSATTMSETSSHNNDLVESLANQAQREIDRLDSALEQVKLMATSSEEVATFAGKIDLAVKAANGTVQEGDRMMEKTVNEILEIRSTVSETGKKVKRLGETFQKISKVVSLVENFATQTNLLALNAAIEATRAGEYGKGFAVVADEVRSLAHQSANATTEISRLVDEIRSGTNEVTEAMEVGIAQVVQGTQMVNDTRQTLSEIVTATNQIGGLVQSITKAANNQSQESQKLTLVMNDVAEIVINTADSASQLSTSFKELMTTSTSLQTSVSRFKVD
jgi:methyl-accepting chemotaxis protein PixJ